MTPTEARLRMEALTQYGDDCFAQCNFREAIIFYKQALSCARLCQGEPKELSCVYGGLSVCYYSLGETQKSFAYANMAVKSAMAVKPKDSFNCAVALNNLAYLEREAGKFAQAEKLYESALYYCRSIDKSDWMLQHLIEADLGDIYAINKKPEKAMAAYEHALRKLKQMLPAEDPLILDLRLRIRDLEIQYHMLNATDLAPCVVPALLGLITSPQIYRE